MARYAQSGLEQVQQVLGQQWSLVLVEIDRTAIRVIGHDLIRKENWDTILKKNYFLIVDHKNIPCFLEMRFMEKK